MNLEAKKIILEALRAHDRYTQGTDRLRTEDKLCVLGVICDVSKQGYWLGQRYVCGEEDSSFSSTILPAPVMKWAGFASLHPYTPDSDDVPKTIRNKGLATLNDKGASFSELADIIEKYF